MYPDWRSSKRFSQVLEEERMRLPWTKIKYEDQIKDGKYDYFRLRVGSLRFEMSLKREDGTLFYFLDNDFNYIPNSVEDIEKIVSEQIENHLEKLKSEILEIESLKLCD